MGVENNECVIATTWDEDSMIEVKSWIQKLPKDQKGLFVFAKSIANCKETVFMAPDGSKKGWKTAEIFERVRNEFVEFLETFNYEDGSNPFDYVEVGYGEFGQKVLRGNCKNMYGDEEYASYEQCRAIMNTLILQASEDFAHSKISMDKKLWEIFKEYPGKTFPFKAKDITIDVKIDVKDK